MTSRSIALGVERVRPRWQSAVFDMLGFVAMIWAIPAAILLIGSPIAIVLMMAARVVRGLIDRL